MGGDTRYRCVSMGVRAPSSSVRRAARTVGWCAPLDTAEPERSQCTLSGSRPGASLRPVPPGRAPIHRAVAQGGVMELIAQQVASYLDGLVPRRDSLTQAMEAEALKSGFPI